MSDPRIGLMPFELLRSHVLKRPDNSALAGETDVTVGAIRRRRRPEIREFGQSKVEQLRRRRSA